MGYNINRYNGSQLTTLNNNTVDNKTTSITLLGRNTTNYGEIMAENLVYMLENFAGTTAPNNPLKGQIWYNTTAGDTKVQIFNGTSWESFGIVADTTPPANPGTGDLWIDLSTNKLKAWLGLNWVIIGPNHSTKNGLANYSGPATLNDVGNNEHQVAVVIINGIVTEVTTTENITVLLSAPESTAGDSNYFNVLVVENLDLQFPIFTGSLPNSQLLKGKNIVVDNFETDTVLKTNKVERALNADKLGNVAASSYLKTSGGTLTNTVYTANLLPSSNLSMNIGSSTAKYSTIHASTFAGNATSANYADLAEKYEIDRPSMPGHLVELGGTKEICLTTKRESVNIYGVLSSQPGFILNSEAGEDDTHPPVALSGRVPCYVVGPVKKGERLVSSDIPGVAMAVSEDNLENVSVYAIIGRALEDKTTEENGLVEIVVGAK